MKAKEIQNTLLEIGSRAKLVPQSFDCDILDNFMIRIMSSEPVEIPHLDETMRHMSTYQKDTFTRACFSKLHGDEERFKLLIKEITAHQIQHIFYNNLENLANRYAELRKSKRKMTLSVYKDLNSLKSYIHTYDIEKLDKAIQVSTDLLSLSKKPDIDKKIVIKMIENFAEKEINYVR